MTVANLKFSGDIIDDILTRASEPTDGTSDFNDLAVVLLNRAYRAIWTGGGELVKGINEPWLWLKKNPPGTLILNPLIESGTVSVANNSSVITFSAAMTPSLAGRFFKVTSHSDVFRVLTHTSGSASATLDSVYTGPTSTAIAYTVLALEYELAADLLRVIAPMRAFNQDRRSIDGIDLLALDRDYPLHLTEVGCPDRFAMVTETKVRFNRYGGATSTELIRLEYDYLQLPADLTDSPTEEPLVPLPYRQVLADAALYNLLVTKNDDRADAIGMQAKAGLSAMAEDNRVRRQQFGLQLGSIAPRPSQVRRQNQVLRTTSGFIVG